MRLRIALLLGFAALPALCADWSPRRAADYMDGRQEDWFAWPRANGGAKPCISCHTGMTYLMARPVLRKALGETEPTKYEKGLLESLRGRLERRGPDGPSIGVESVMAALFLRTPEAYDRMWALQIREGNAAGSWKWFTLDQDPWEQTESPLFGAALAAMAVKAAPPEYRNRPEVRERVEALAAYLRAPHENQPFQNRLAIAWSSSDEKLRATVAKEALAKQEADGGWTLESLGPWRKHAAAPPPKPGNSTYATAFTTYVLLQCGVSPSTPAMAKALGWLRTHQSEHGYWYAESMNRVYEPDSIESRFMRDGATAFAVLALLER